MLNLLIILAHASIIGNIHNIILSCEVSCTMCIPSKLVHVINQLTTQGIDIAMYILTVEQDICAMYVGERNLKIYYFLEIHIW